VIVRASSEATRAPVPLLALIHPIAWKKVNSANFAQTEFSETNFCQWILGNQEGMRA
jgi:hypothetical protein